MDVLSVEDKVKMNKLDLRGYNLKEIPIKEIVSLNITHLDLSNNKIISTKNVFTLLTSLLELNLSNNSITSIAGDISSLQKLTHLSLANNMIKDLPKGMISLNNLKYLNLSNNPLNSKLTSALGPSLTKTQYQAVAANALQYLKDKRDFKTKDNNLNNKKTKKCSKMSRNVIRNTKLESRSLYNKKTDSLKSTVYNIQNLSATTSNALKCLIDSTINFLKQVIGFGMSIIHFIVENISNITESFGHPLSYEQCQLSATNALQYLKDNKNVV